MRPTRRGYGVVGVGVGGFLLAALFGPRAINAVVVPAVVALVAAAVQLRRLDPPRVERRVPPDGFPGETGRVELRFDTDSPFAGVVTDAVDDGLDAEPSSVETTVGAGPVGYDVTYRRRGERRYGPVGFVARDVLGLLETEFSVAATSTGLAYPAIRRLTPDAVADLGALYDTSIANERDEFDTLREYERGDPLRDVHWKSTAKREALIVKEFVAETDPQAVTVAAGAATGEVVGDGDDPPADRMAAATASVALSLLSVGAPVRVAVPDGEVEAAPGAERSLLEFLSRAGAGPVPVPDAEVVVEATATGTAVTIGDVERSFDRLAGDRRDTVMEDAPDDVTAAADAPREVTA
jgi:uncharacterized protein (DUF58 family)